jgi:hypothetical protein
MRNVSESGCRENKKARFLFNIFSSKTARFMRNVEEILHSLAGHRRKQG